MNMQTIKACVSAVVVIAVALFGALGIDLDSSALENVLGSVVFLVATGYGIWKNHNFTGAAQEAQQYLDIVKAGNADLRGDEQDYLLEEEVCK